MNKIRPRISLLTLMFLMTILAMAAGLWKLNSELVPLRREVLEYRQVLGNLTIPEDAQDKIHAIQLPAESSHEWRYRIYLPPGRSYNYRITEGTIPARQGKKPRTKREFLKAIDDKSSSSSRTCEPGEFLLTFQVRPEDDPADDRPNWVFQLKRDNSTKSKFTTTVPWMEDTRCWSVSESMVNRKQKEYASDEPLKLLLVRRAVVEETARGGWSTRSADAASETDGFSLWIAPSP